MAEREQTSFASFLAYTKRKYFQCACFSLLYKTHGVSIRLHTSRSNVRILSILSIFVFFIAILVSPSLTYATTLYWRGASANWNTASNWSQSSGGPADGWVPTSTDTAVFDSGSVADCTLNANVTVAGISITSGYTGTTTQSSSYTITVGSGGWTQAGGTFSGGQATTTINGNVSITGGKLTHQSNTTAETYKLIWVVSGDYTLDTGATINVVGSGYSGGNGPGSGFYSGASYGGVGGYYNGVKSTYGSITAPTNIGSGGYTNNGGGGAVILNVTGSVTLNGTITAEGKGISYVDGGGSGGSVYIQAGSMSGSGTISVNGGSVGNVGAGGGGRISVILNSGNSFGSVTMTAYGGNGLPNFGNSTIGAAGTIYTQTATQGAGNGTLTVDNYNLLTGSTTDLNSSITGLPSGSITVQSKGVLTISSTTLNVGTNTVTINTSGSIVVNSGGALNLTGGTLTGDATSSVLKLNGGTFTTSPTFSFSNVNLWLAATSTFNPSTSFTVGSGALFTSDVGNTFSGNVTVSSSGVMSHSVNLTMEAYRLNLTIGGNLTIDGSINVNGSGYSGNNGPGAGGTCGASYGGMGGKYTPVKPTYGSITAPTNIGSGGYNGNNGGGAVLLNVAGSVALNGIIKAEGIGSSYGNGGGSGGSVYIQAGSISGSGSISVKGATVLNVGGGGGGRISVILNSGNSFGSVTMTAYGGTGVLYNGSSTSGAAGTIYTQTASQGTGDGILTIDNNNYSTFPDIITDLDGNSARSINVGSIVIANKGIFSIGSDDTLTLSGSTTTVTIYSGATLANNGVLNIGGTGGSSSGAAVFSASGNSVNYTSSSNQSVLPATYYNLTKQATSSSATLTFTSASTTAVTNNLVLTGTASSTLSLRSSTPGTQFYINPSGTKTLSYLDVMDGKNTNATVIDATDGTFTDSGHNRNWNFPGVFLSSVHDSGSATSRYYAALSWHATTPANTSIVMYLRGGNTATPDGTWTSFSSITNGQDISSYNSYRYLQYKAVLSNTDFNSVPSLDDVTISYEHYTTSGTLTSSVYDSTDLHNIPARISWDENAPSGTYVGFQIRTSPNNSTWTDYTGPGGSLTNLFTATSTGCSKQASTVTCNLSGAGSISDGTGDRYMQYQMNLFSNNATTTSPFISNVTLTYVVNATPEFDTTYPSNPGSGAVASQSTDTTVSIGYRVRDPDGSTGTNTRGKVLPSFQYSLDGGSTWTSISSGDLNPTDTALKDVDDTNFTTYSAIWHATSTLPNSTYTTSAKVKVIINDGEAANNIASSTTASFTLDTKTPVYGTVPIHVDASVSPANVYLSCTDDSSINMLVGKLSDLSDATSTSYSSSSTISFSNGDTIYARCMDVHGNAASIVSATPPQAPNTTFYQDTSNVDSSEYREFLAWSVSPVITPTFQRYNIFHSIDGSGFSLLGQVSNRTTNYYVDANLSASSTYNYKINTEDANGSISPFSTVITDTPNGVGGSDIAKPTISVVNWSNVPPPTSVTVTWTTDKLSNSTVYYSVASTSPGTDPGNYTSSQGVPSYVTSHEVIVNNLVPGTQYYFLVASTDASGNTGTDTSDSDTFTTAAGPIISNVNIPEVFGTEAKVNWTTNVEANSVVVYATTTAFTSAQSITGSGTLSTNHSVTLSGLTAGQTYYFYVQSADSGGNTAYDKHVVGGELVYYSFTTPIDNTAPQISNVATSLIGEAGATISWTTDEPSLSEVSFGTDSNLTSLATSSDVYTKEHAVTLSGLSNSTSYVYAVASTDMAGNRATDNNHGGLYTFTTLAPTTVTQAYTRTFDNRDLSIPIITNINVTVGSTTATVNWKTSKPALEDILYGPTLSFGKEFSNTSSYTANHAVDLKNLIPSTLYHFRITSTDFYGNTDTSNGDYTFTTLGENASSTVVTSSQEEEKTTPPPAEQTLSPNEQTLLDKIASALKASSMAFSRQVFFDSAAVLNETDLVASVVEITDKAVSAPAILGTDIKVEPGPTYADISWTTDKLANSLVAYAEAKDYAPDTEKPYTIKVGESLEYVTQHTVKVDGLTPATTYHFQTLSQGRIGPVATSTDHTFNTLSLTPDITDFKWSDIKESEATLNWSTALPTKASITLTSAKDGKVTQKEDNSYLKDHTMSFTGLEPASSYTVLIKSVDESSSTASSNLIPFSTILTKNPPIISNIKTTSSLVPGKVEKVQTIITWTTDKPATSALRYEEGVLPSEDLPLASENDPSLVQDHILITTAFKPNTVYRFKVESTDVLGNVTRSDDNTILTPKGRETIVDVLVKNFETTFGFLKGK